MDVNSRDFQTRLNRDLYPCYELREVVNQHHSIMFNEIRPPPFQNRTMVVSLVWKKVCDEPLTYLWCAVSIDSHPSVRPEDEAHALRADLARCVRLTALSSQSTKLEMVTSLDLKGNFPSWFVNAVILPQILRLPAALQMYFAMVHEANPAGSYSADDGRIVAHLMMDATKIRKLVYTSNRARKRQAAAVAKFVMRTEMFNDAGFGHVCDMLKSIVGNEFHKVRVVAATDPALFTHAEATAIGESCKAIRLRHLHPETAVDELLHNYVALRTFSRSNAWFRPLVETIFLRQAQASKLDSMFKVFCMAGLSMFDVTTDVLTVGGNFALGQIGTAITITGLVLTSQALQILIVVVKNAHCGWRTVLKEVGIVLSFFKPTIDVARMLEGHEVAGAPFTTHEERTICKIIESVVESIPTMLIQLARGLSGHDILSWASLLSISVSWATTASKAGMIAFDLDLSPRKRSGAPRYA
jgi:hypothetical protein